MDNNNAIVDFLLKDNEALEAAITVAENIGEVSKRLADKYLDYIYEKLNKSQPPVQRVVCTGAISPCYRPAPKDAGFHIVQAILPLPLLPSLKGRF